MAIYEIDTLKQSLKKYAVTLTIGLGAGIYLSSCGMKLGKTWLENKQGAQTPYNTQVHGSKLGEEHKPRALTREEERLKVFETYTRP